jgi:hypothetical protein
MTIPPLSQAIVLGSIGTKQGKDNYSSNGTTCAMGAALTALGAITRGTSFVANRMNQIVACNLWPWLRLEIACPVTGKRSAALNVIQVLNDTHDWTRPRIADWVATIEPEPATPPVAQDVICTAKI